MTVTIANVTGAESTAFGGFVTFTAQRVIGVGATSMESMDNAEAARGRAFGEGEVVSAVATTELRPHTVYVAPATQRLLRAASIPTAEARVVMLPSGLADVAADSAAHTGTRHGKRK